MAVVADVEVGVLGPALVSVAGRQRRINAAKQRALLTLLALRANERVSTDTLVDVLWGAEASPTAVTTLRGYVADLRRVLEPGRPRHGAPSVLVTEPGGYLLSLPRERVDVARLESAVRAASSRIDLLGDPWRPEVADADLPDALETAASLDLALALWRGEPLADLGAHPDVDVERERLYALRLEGQVIRMGLLVGMGRHARAVAELDRLCRAHPWHEHLWGLRALALAASGRQVEALTSLGELRRSLDDHLGIAPDPHVVRLEADLFGQDVLMP